MQPPISDSLDFLIQFCDLKIREIARVYRKVFTMFDFFNAHVLLLKT